MCIRNATFAVIQYIARCHVNGVLGEAPSLLFANRHDIRRINLYSGNYQLLVDGLKSAVAIDYDYEEDKYFWTDIALETINM